TGFTGLERILTAYDLKQLERVVGIVEIHIDETIEEALPELGEDALYGIIGEIVRATDPHTEAHRMTTVINTLAAFGSCIGSSPHTLVQHDRHSGNLYAVFVGQSAKGRKGVGWSTPRHLFSKIDPEWSKNRVRTGLSSGEGLIYAVRDEVWREEPVKEKGRVIDYQMVRVDPGEPDKRLFLIESEFSSTLTVM